MTTTKIKRDSVTSGRQCGRHWVMLKVSGRGLSFNTSVGVIQGGKTVKKKIKVRK